MSDEKPKKQMVTFTNSIVRVERSDGAVVDTLIEAEPVVELIGTAWTADKLRANFAAIEAERAANWSAPEPVDVQEASRALAPSTIAAELAGFKHEAEVQRKRADGWRAELAEAVELLRSIEHIRQPEAPFHRCPVCGSPLDLSEPHEMGCKLAAFLARHQPKET